MVDLPSKRVVALTGVALIAMLSSRITAAPIFDATQQNLFSANAGALATSSSVFPNDAFVLANANDRAVDTEFIFDSSSSDPDMRLNFHGFNSSIADICIYWSGDYGPNNFQNVTVYYAGASTASLDPAAYTEVGTFVPIYQDYLVNGQPQLGNNYSGGAYELAGYPDAGYLRVADLADLGIPGGTQSVLLQFTPNSHGLTIMTEVQAYSGTPIPEPATLALLAVGGLGGLARRRS